MNIKWKFILWGTLFYLAGGVVLYLLLEINKWYFLIGEFLLLISLILFVILYQQLVRPVDTLRTAINFLKEKDFSTRLSPVKQKEINELVDVYNSMSLQLHQERVEHEEKNLFLDLLIDASPLAILVFNDERRIEISNPSAKKLFRLKNGEKPKIQELQNPWKSKLSDIKPGQSLTVKTDGGCQFKVICGSFMNKGFHKPFVLIEELTRELLNAERQSYEKVIRMMSHEVNNSVGAVNSVLQSIQSVSSQFDENTRDDISNAVKVAIERNISLSRFMTNFSEVVKLPLPNKKEVDLSQIVEKTLSLLTVQFEQKWIKVTYNHISKKVMADSVQIEQVLVNILKNSIEAIEHEEGLIEVKLDDDLHLISISDNGKGFTDDVYDKLFTPFFSTKKSGQGIGLILVREILMNHGWNFKFHRLDEKNMTEFIIFFS